MENNQSENNDSLNVDQEGIDSSNDVTITSDTAEPERREGETKEEFTEREKQYYARIKKLEDENKRLKQSSAQTVNVDGLSQSDLIFVAKADIHEDDINDVLRWAKNDGLSVKEAYAQYKPILDTRAQERQTAQATEIRSARGKKPESGEALLEKASKGELKPTETNIRDLVRARQQMRRDRASR